MSLNPIPDPENAGSQLISEFIPSAIEAKQVYAPVVALIGVAQAVKKLSELTHGLMHGDTDRIRSVAVQIATLTKICEAAQTQMSELQSRFADAASLEEEEESHVPPVRGVVDDDESISSRMLFTPATMPDSIRRQLEKCADIPNLEILDGEPGIDEERTLASGPQIAGGSEYLVSFRQRYSDPVGIYRGWLLLEQARREKIRLQSRMEAAEEREKRREERRRKRREERAVPELSHSVDKLLSESDKRRRREKRRERRAERKRERALRAKELRAAERRILGEDPVPNEVESDLFVAVDSESQIPEEPGSPLGPPVSGGGFTALPVMGTSPRRPQPDDLLSQIRSGVPLRKTAVRPRQVYDPAVSDLASLLMKQLETIRFEMQRLHREDDDDFSSDEDDFSSDDDGFLEDDLPDRLKVMED